MILIVWHSCQNRLLRVSVWPYLLMPIWCQFCEWLRVNDRQWVNLICSNNFERYLGSANPLGHWHLKSVEVKCQWLSAQHLYKREEDSDLCQIMIMFLRSCLFICVNTCNITINSVVLGGKNKYCCNVSRIRQFKMQFTKLSLLVFFFSSFPRSWRPNHQGKHFSLVIRILRTVHYLSRFCVNCANYTCLWTRIPQAIL